MGHSLLTPETDTQTAERDKQSQAKRQAGTSQDKLRQAGRHRQGRWIQADPVSTYTEIPCPPTERPRLTHRDILTDKYGHGHGQSWAQTLRNIYKHSHRTQPHAERHGQDQSKHGLTRTKNQTQTYI